MKKLNRAFFRKDAEELARALIGTVVVHRVNGKEYRARIVETEAYVGTHDLACHAAKGKDHKPDKAIEPPQGFVMLKSAILDLYFGFEEGIYARHNHPGIFHDGILRIIPDKKRA